MAILHAGCYPVVMCKTEYYGDSTCCMLASCNVQDRILCRFYMLDVSYVWCARQNIM